MSSITKEHEVEQSTDRKSWKSNLGTEGQIFSTNIRSVAIRAPEDLGTVGTLSPAMERELGSDPGITIFANSG